MLEQWTRCFQNRMETGVEDGEIAAPLTYLVSGDASIAASRVELDSLTNGQSIPCSRRGDALGMMN